MGFNMFPNAWIVDRDVRLMGQGSSFVVLAPVIAVGELCFMLLNCFYLDVSVAVFFIDTIDEAVPDGVIEVGCHGAFVGLICFIRPPHCNEAFLKEFLMRIVNVHLVDLVVNPALVLLVNVFKRYSVVHVIAPLWGDKGEIGWI